MSEFVRVSEISALLFCQRYCYFSMLDEVKPGEMSAFRVIYTCTRSKAGSPESRFLAIYGEEYRHVFEKAVREFVYSKELDRLESVELELELSRKDLMLTGVLDELVKSKKLEPLVLSSKSPEDGVWFADRIKLAAFCILLESDYGVNSGFVYYCKSGELRHVEVSRKDRQFVFRAVDRIRKLRRGFLPEREESNRCRSCKYREVCESEGETFASKFL